MSDDTRRPGQDDENPTDPPTGEGEVVGADWLLSELDREQTGEIDIPRRAAAESGDDRPAKAGDNPVLAWWREKLVAADGLVNPDPRPDQTDDDDVVLPEPGWTARSSSDGTEPGLFSTRRRNFEPSSVDGDRHSDDDGRDDVDGSADDQGWSLGAETPADEPETGLIPAADPPLFKPRSAREHIVETPEPVSAASVVPEPVASQPVASEPVAPEPVVPEPVVPEPVASEPVASGGTDDDENDSDENDEETAPFSWALTPNDELDPVVHRATGGEQPPVESPARKQPAPVPLETGQPDTEGAAEPTAVLPTVAAASASQDGSVADADSGESAPSRRRARRQAERPEAQPIVIDAVPDSRVTPVKQAKAPRAAQPPKPSTSPAQEGNGPGRRKPPRALVLGALALVAVLILGGLFFLGSRLPALLAAPTPTASETPPPTASATPTPTVAPPTGPAALGEQKWTALAGGECLDPYSTPWAETFTVVDCAAAHPAQMVFSAPVNTDPEATYPGEDAILAQINLWCSAPGVLDADAAGQYSDLQVQGTYPVSEEQWAAGERTYYCFVSRSSGEPLTGSLAVAQG
ncbi:hypothetical protein IWX78_001737 [Mycetocola sp. CAN_C7]|uniref:septum formation family protein n=1 Tax=Mycetocola sp. CAN_C7 TaxID=2787724 RepID=UPI0018CB3D8E